MCASTHGCERVLMSPGLLGCARAHRWSALDGVQMECNGNDCCFCKRFCKHSWLMSGNCEPTPHEHSAPIGRSSGVKCGALPSSVHSRIHADVHRHTHAPIQSYIQTCCPPSNMLASVLKSPFRHAPHQRSSYCRIRSSDRLIPGHSNFEVF